MIEFLLYPIYITLTLLIILFSGIIASSFIKIKNQSIDFLFIIHLIFGLITLIVFYAIIKSNLDSVLLGVFILLPFFKNYLKFKPVYPKYIISKAYLKLFSLASSFAFIFFLIEYYWLVDLNSGILIVTPHYDFLSYSGLSHFLNANGDENFNHIINNIYSNYANVRVPYHYPEIWFNSFIEFLTFKSSLKCLMLICYPILKSILVINILLFIKGYCKISFIKSTIIALTLISITGFYFSFYNNYDFLKYYNGITQTGPLMSFGRKYLLLYIYISFILFHVFLNKKYRDALILFLAIPIFSIGTTPGFYFGIFVLSIYLYKIKRISRNDFIVIILSIMLSTLFLVLYYSFHNNKEANNVISDSLLFIKLINNPQFVDFKSLFWGMFFPSIRVLIFYLPYTVLLLFFSNQLLKETSRLILIFLISVLIGGCLAAALLNGMPDCGQFFYNVLPLLNVTFVLFFILLIYNSNKLNNTKYLVFVIALYGIYNLYCNFNYYKNSIAEFNTIPINERIDNLKLVKEATKGKEATGVFFADDLNSEVYSFNYSNYRYKHYYLQFLDNYSDAINIGIDCKIDNNTSTDRFNLIKNPYFIFLKINNLKNTRESMMKFINLTKSSFICIGSKLQIIDGINDLPFNPDENQSQ